MVNLRISGSVTSYGVKLIRANPEFVRENLRRRNDPNILKLLDEFIKYDEKWRLTQTRINEIRRKRNEISRRIAQVKKEGGDVAKVLEEAEKIQEEIKRLKVEVDKYKEKSLCVLMRIPNLLHESVPYGKDETENVEIRRWGSSPKFDFKPKNHLEVALNLGLIDGERASKVAGMGFYYLKEELVLLDLAIQRFAIDFLRRRGYVLIESPFMLRRKPYEGVTDLSDFER